MYNQLLDIEMALREPFQEAAKENRPELIDMLMHFETPTRIKKDACSAALEIACSNNNSAVIKKLIEDYPSFIENPCYNFAFQWAALCSPKTHANIVTTILHHPHAVEDLQDLIQHKRYVYKNCIEQYQRLLGQAQAIRAAKKS